jgi:uncharacterized coiled-coil protein SlyX
MPEAFDKKTMEELKRRYGELPESIKKQQATLKKTMERLTCLERE